MTVDELVAKANATGAGAGRTALALLADEHRSDYQFPADQLWRFLVKKGAAK